MADVGPEGKWPVPRTRRYVEKRTLLTRQEERKVSDLLDEIASRAECSISFSHLVRGLLKLALQATDDETLDSLDFSQLKRPVNGDEAGLERFEQRIAGLLEQALKRARENVR